MYIQNVPIQDEDSLGRTFHVVRAPTHISTGTCLFLIDGDFFMVLIKLFVFDHGSTGRRCVVGVASSDVT
jgi:hypothetical protein